MASQGEAGADTKGHPSRPRARALLLGSVSALVAALAAGGWYLCHSPEPLARFRLTDGTPVAVETITVGEPHQLIHGNRLQRALYPVLPSAYRRLIGGHLHDMEDAAGGVLLWLTWSPSHRAAHSWRLVSVDDHGLEVGVAHPSLLECPRESGDTATFYTMALPRREAMLRFRLYEENAAPPWRKISEFSVPNPAPGPYPVWTPEPLPIVRREDNLEFRLVEFRTGIRPHQPDQPAEPGTEAWTFARFRVTQLGKPAPWRPVSLQIVDATGNLWILVPSEVRSSGEFLDWHLEGALTPSESAYRIAVEFWRTGGFQEKELWMLRNVPIPLSGRASAIGKVREVSGITVRALGVTGPGGDLGPGLFHHESGAHAIFMKTPILPHGFTLDLVEATDDRGRQISTGGPFWGEGDYRFSLRPRPGARTANFTFALYRSREVEFIARATASNATEGEVNGTGHGHGAAR